METIFREGDTCQLQYECTCISALLNSRFCKVKAKLKVLILQVLQNIKVSADKIINASSFFSVLEKIWKLAAAWLVTKALFYTQPIYMLQ